MHPQSLEWYNCSIMTVIPSTLSNTLRKVTKTPPHQSTDDILLSNHLLHVIIHNTSGAS